MNAHESFLAEIESNPLDATTLLVYADWLEERGDDRAEYLRGQIELRASPTQTQRQKLRSRYPQHHIGWVSRLEQCGALNPNLTELEFAWPSARIGPYRQAEDTNRRCRFQDLPPLPTHLFDGSFGWLLDEPCDGPWGGADVWARFLRHFQDQGRYVPQSLQNFFTHPSLPRQVQPYFARDFVGSPENGTFDVGEDGLFVTLLASVISKEVWGILLPSASSQYTPILGGTPSHPSVFSVDSEYPLQTFGANVDDPYFLDSHQTFIAPNLESFLYRCLIESAIHFKAEVELSGQLTLNEQQYLDRLYDIAGRRGKTI